MKKKIMAFSGVCLEPKIIEQVRLGFSNKSILNEIDRFTDPSEKEEYLLQIKQDFSSFMEKYKQNPKDELISLFSLQPNEIHSAYDSRDFKILIDKLLVKNKYFKKQIKNKSLKPIAEPWVELFNKSMLDLLKWGPTAIIIIGFLKAFILSEVLDFSLSSLFSLQDYWDYGISDSTGFILGIIGFSASFYSQFYFAEFADFNYIKPAGERYKPTLALPKFSELLIPNIIFAILLISCFVLPSFSPKHIKVIFSVFGACLLYLIFSITCLINQYTYKLLPKVSITAVLVFTLFNLWIIPKTIDPEFPEFHSNTIVNTNITLSLDAFYVDSSTKYHIFSDGQKTYLIPFSNVIYITR